MQRCQAVAVMGAEFQHRVIQPFIHGFELVDEGAQFLINQVGLVEHECGGDTRQLRRHQITVQQGAGRGGQGREHYQHLLHVGGHWLEITVGVRSLEDCVPGLDGHDDSEALALGGLPDHPVAHHQLFQGGAEVTATTFAIGAFYLHLLAKVGGDDAQLLVAQVIGHQFFQLLIAFLGAFALLRLDLFDAPALAAVEFTFGHDGRGIIPVLGWGHATMRSQPPRSEETNHDRQAQQSDLDRSGDDRPEPGERSHH